jgi:pimeloyl-ACP methyl ester carboxylesterase
MATFLVAHGAWSAGWTWKKMRPRLRALGHELFTPTYTGLGERRHLASRDIGLDTHVTDICAVIAMEELRDVVLIGHSYGGMVATAVADRMTANLSQLVYLDAFVPRDGQSLFDLHPPDVRDRMRAAAQQDGEGWRVPAMPPPPDTPPEDRAWMLPRRIAHPIKCFSDRVELTGKVDVLPRTYIYATRSGPGDGFRQFAERARTEPGWQYLEIDSSHNPHVTAPDRLAELLHDIAGARQD